MINRKFFFDIVRRDLFGGKLTKGQTEGMEAILNEWEAQGHCCRDDRHLAYMLATVYHETDRTMRPIEEYGKGKKYRYGKHVKMDGKPYPADMPLYYGRGFVQLTWYENYERAGRMLNANLLQTPELALNLCVATRILFAGMQEGWFTGKKLSDYFNDTKEDWVNARRIINGTDRAQMIADYGKKFYAALSHTG